MKRFVSDSYVLNGDGAAEVGGRFESLTAFLQIIFGLHQQAALRLQVQLRQTEAEATVYTQIIQECH